MSGDRAALLAHLATGTTGVCRAWAVQRRDGRVFGFTDHDRDLGFEGMVFRADTGLSAKALQQTTGLSVDNAEAVGALSDASVTEDDILAGRFDWAAVTAWLLRWAAPEARIVLFRGTLGEVVRQAGSFRAELRGLTEALNRPVGRVYGPDCAAVLGDAACRFDTGLPGYQTEMRAERVEGGRSFRFTGGAGFDDRWFEAGRLEVLEGPAAGLSGVIKNDRVTGGARIVDLWQALRPAPGAGALLRLVAGCDRRAGTCRLKFNNFINFRGFPQIPGEDWQLAYPTRTGVNDGGSLG